MLFIYIAIVYLILAMLIILFFYVVFVIPVLFIAGLVKFFNVYIRQEKNKVTPKDKHEDPQNVSESPKYSPRQIIKRTLFVVASILGLGGNGLFAIGLMISVMLGGDNAVEGPPLMKFSGIIILISLFLLAAIALEDQINLRKNTQNL